MDDDVAAALLFRKGPLAVDAAQRLLTVQAAAGLEALDLLFFRCGGAPRSHRQAAQTRFKKQGHIQYNDQRAHFPAGFDLLEHVLLNQGMRSGVEALQRVLVPKHN